MNAAPLWDTHGAHGIIIIVIFCDCSDMGGSRMTVLEMLPRMTDNEKNLDGDFQLNHNFLTPSPFPQYPSIKISQVLQVDLLVVFYFVLLCFFFKN